MALPPTAMEGMQMAADYLYSLHIEEEHGTASSLPRRPSWCTISAIDLDNWKFDADQGEGEGKWLRRSLWYIQGSNTLLRFFFFESACLYGCAYLGHFTIIQRFMLPISTRSSPIECPSLVCSWCFLYFWSSAIIIIIIIVKRSSMVYHCYNCRRSLFLFFFLWNSTHQKRRIIQQEIRPNNVLTHSIFPRHFFC